MIVAIKKTLCALLVLAVGNTLVAQNSKSSPGGKINLIAGVELGGHYQLERLTKTMMSGKSHTAIEDYTLTATAYGQEGKDKLVRSKVDRVRLETDATGDGATIAYDSADRGKQHPGLAEQGKGMLTITSAAIYGENDVFKSFEGQAADEGTRSMMQKLTDLGFPDKPVGPGDTWKHRIDTDMGQLGRVSYDLDYKFVKMVRHEGVNCALLTISGKISTVPGANANEGFDLKSRSLRGVMYFDPKLGVVRKNEINSQLDLTAYGKKMPGSMTMRTVLKKFTKG
ncbi:MAG: hypothetical protein ACI8XO_002916 [Verrucomicrobiales bacterium]|jgi:hypothetical protein